MESDEIIHISLSRTLFPDLAYARNTKMWASAHASVFLVQEKITVALLHLNVPMKKYLLG